MPKTQSVSTDIINRIHDAFDNGLPQDATQLASLSADVFLVIEHLNQGVLRVAEKLDNQWYTHQWLKKAILLSFRLSSNNVIGDGQPFAFYDKLALKTDGWEQSHFEESRFRMVPGSIVRKGAHICPNVILMPSFVNIGAYVGDGTMVDTWSTIGSCAQIGRNCHISGGVGIGGVLEPVQANPVIIEDNCFIGARSEIAEGVIVEEGAVVSMGVFIGASTKIVDRATGEITYGRVPAYSVVVPGVLPSASTASGLSVVAGQEATNQSYAHLAKPVIPYLACAVIVKRVDAQTRSKTAINDLLRD